MLREVAEGVVAAADNYVVALFAPHWRELGTLEHIAQIRARFDSSNQRNKGTHLAHKYNTFSQEKKISYTKNCKTLKVGQGRN